MKNSTDQILVELDWLDAKKPSPLLIDARPGPDYRRGHIPGAIHLDTFPYANDRTDPEGLKKIEADWARMFGEAGLRQDETVVFYDAGTENRAPRGAFMLRYLGHKSSHVLHGGIAAWVEAGRPLSKDVPERAAVDGSPFPVQTKPKMIATAQRVLEAMKDPNVVILDVREEPEYTGKRRLQWNPRMGRIPGVAYITWWKLLRDKRRFQPSDELRKMFEEQGVTPDKEVIVYCQKSHRATNTYLALESLGYPRKSVYIGSFREWSRQPDLPVER